MIKESTYTIYQYLPASFWTQRTCFRCQAFFTNSDYTHTNYLKDLPPPCPKKENSTN